MNVSKKKSLPQERSTSDGDHRRIKVQLAAEHFVRIWQENSAAETARILGKTVASVTSKASWYRRLGVPLKNDKTPNYIPRPQLDFDSLIIVALKFAPKEEEG